MWRPDLAIGGRGQGGGAEAPDKRLRRRREGPDAVDNNSGYGSYGPVSGRLENLFADGGLEVAGAGGGRGGWLPRLRERGGAVVEHCVDCGVPADAV